MTTFPYTIHPKLVLRTPARAFEKILQPDRIAELLNDAAFLEAIYLASPVLYRECLKLKSGQITLEKEKSAIETSLAKYYQRMFSRSTPFGLFSGCALTDWVESDGLLVVNTAAPGRHTRFDMHYLCALAQHLAALPFIKERLVYYPNNSCYHTSTEIRYVEYHYVDGRRVFQVSALGRTDYLDEVLEAARPGATLRQLQLLLVNDDITAEEADDYLDALLQSQALVSELEPAITGAEFMQQLLQGLEKINHPGHEGITAIIRLLRRMEGATNALDAATVNPVQAYLDIMELAQQPGLPFEENKLFQTDLVCNVQQGGLARHFQPTLEAAVHALFALSNAQKNTNLDAFALRFRERYEDAEMPLLAVLDGETGIGYPENYGQSPSALLGDLHLPESGNRKQELPWDEKQFWLLQKMQDVIRERRYEIDITADDLKELKPGWEEVPPSFSVMFRVVDDGNVIIDNCGGSSAAALLGRFAYSDESINQLVTDITKAEQQQNPDVVFAEVVHLPESRVGNILLHPVFRGYEIPYLAASSLPAGNQLTPDDLYVSVRNHRIVLRSARLNKEIIPRLSSAHNYSYNALPVYRFLCELQTQQLKASAGFNWGVLAPYYQFLPRVRCGKAILHEATWQLNKKDLDTFVAALQQQDFTAVAHWQLPRLLVLADGDNELLLDCTGKLSVAAFLQTVKNRSSVVLREFLYGQEGPVKTTGGATCISQFIASFVKTATVYTPTEFSTATTPQRLFSPGSEWVYYKAYCGVHASEDILLQHLYPVIQALLADGLVREWFFIRFADPAFHLRLRLRLTDTGHTGIVITRLSDAFQPLVQQRLIWKLQTDTYQRELERYGDGLIEQAEQLFFIDSEIKILFLQHTEGDEREQWRWPWAMRQVDWLLDCFNYTTADKEQLLKELKTGFATEFRMDKAILRQMNKKYGASRKLLEGAMLENAEAHPQLAALSGLQHVYTEQVRQLAAGIIAGCAPGGHQLSRLLSSYIHMCLNRIFADRPRQQEAVLYDYLYKWYVSLKYQHPQPVAADDDSGDAKNPSISL